MKRLLLVAVALAMLAGLSTAALATLSFQTQPILGTGVSYLGNGGLPTGHVTMITGPTPINPVTGLPYLDEGGNTVLGPTIPHYSDPLDPLYHVGSPSMTEFWFNPNTVGIGGNAGHMVDLNAWVYSGSGVSGTGVASYTGVFTFLGTPGNPTYDVPSATGEWNFDEDSFVMVSSGVGQFWLEDAGPWRYTETWTNNANALDTITSTSDFDLKAVPEPMSIILGIMGLSSIAGFRKLRRK